MKEIKINQNDANQRLDKFLMKTFPKLGKSMMYKAIRNKKIKVNRKRCTFVYDLSQFNGNNVVIAIGIFNGEKRI